MLAVVTQNAETTIAPAPVASEGPVLPNIPAALHKRYRFLRRAGRVAATVLMAPFKSFDLLRNMVVSLAVLGFSVALCLLVYKALISKAIVISPLSVPSVLEERGLTGEVMARRLTDEIRRISAVSSTNRERAAVGGAAIESKLAEVDVPIAGINFRAIVTTLRTILGLKDQQIGGEITMAGLIPAKSPDSDDEKPAPPAQFEVTLRASDGGAFHKSAKALVDLDGVIREAAIEVIQHIDPFLAASYYRTLKDYRSMERMLVGILKEGSTGDRQWALNLRGAALRDQRRYGEALVTLKEAVKAAPDWNAPRINLIQTLRLMRRFEESEAIGREYLVTAPNDSRTMINLALTLQESGKAVESKALFEKAYAVSPLDSVVAANLANQMRNRKELKEADQLLERNWSVFRKERVALNVRGLIMRDMGNFDEAELLFDEAANKAGPSLYPQPANALGNLQLQRGKPELAIKSFDLALTEDPMFFPSFSGKGDALRALKRFKEAESSYRESIKLRPDASYERHYLGISLKEQKKLRDAAVAFSDAARFLPHRQDTIVEWSAVLLQLNRTNEAVDVLTAGLDHFPKDATISEQLGDALQRSRNWMGASSAYKLAILADDKRKVKLEPVIARLERSNPSAKQ